MGRAKHPRSGRLHSHVGTENESSSRLVNVLS